MNAPASTVHATARPLHKLVAAFARIPHDLVALVARLSLAGTFWLSGQTKVEGLLLDPIGGEVELGMPRLSGNAVDLFRYEYALPLIPPEIAALLAATAEHVFPCCWCSAWPPACRHSGCC